MLTTKDATLMYETLLMFPGMNASVEIPLSVKRKTLLILAKMIELGVSKEAAREGILSVMDQETTDELRSIAVGLLEKGGLSELNVRLDSISIK